MSANNVDIYDQKFGRFIDPQAIKELSKIKSWRGIGQIALEWVGIAVSIAICKTYWHPLLYIITIAWIGARQNALAVMMHESVHYRLLPNKKWNDWIGEIFAAWPILITVDGFRQTHFPHHRYVNTLQDPDWVRQTNDMEKFYPRSMSEVVITTLKYWLGYYAIADLLEFQFEAKISRSVQIGRSIFYISILAMSIAFNFWLGLLMYWVVPLFTFFIWVFYVRAIAEHSLQNYDDVLKKTRHVEANLFERLMIAPSSIGVHIAHHLYPSIPFYNLKKVQNLLMQNPEYAKRAHISKSYLSLIKESIESNKKHFQGLASS